MSENGHVQPYNVDAVRALRAALGASRNPRTVLILCRGRRAVAVRADHSLTFHCSLCGERVRVAW